MKFKTKVSDSERRQSPLYNRKCSHLLSDEQDFFPLRHQIGNHSGYRLRLTGSGRSVKNECHPMSCHFNRLELRRIYRNGKVSFPVIQILCRGDIPIDMSFHQTAYYFAVIQ